jgi:hypothetical protein
METVFLKYLELPLYYETEKQDIINEIHNAISKSKKRKRKFSVIDIRNSILKQNTIEDDIENF